MFDRPTQAKGNRMGLDRLRISALVHIQPFFEMLILSRLKMYVNSLWWILRAG